MTALAARPWPGKVRELRNAVERLLILAPGRRISAAAVERLLGGYQARPVLEAAAFALPFVEFMERAEKLYVESRLKENDGKIAETARAIDIPRSSLYKKMERFGLIKADE